MTGAERTRRSRSLRGPAPVTEFEAAAAAEMLAEDAGDVADPLGEKPAAKRVQKPKGAP